MTRRVFTPDQDKEVTELYRQGYSTRRIAELYNCEKRAVSNALEREGVPRRTNRDLTDSEEAEIVKIYYAGYPPRRIARAYGKSEVLIKGALSRQGAKKFKDFRFNFCKAEEEQIAKIYLAGYSTEKIARVYGCVMKTIKNILDRQGILTRQAVAIEKSIKRSVEVSRLYQNGSSTKSLSEQYHLHQGTIAKYLRKTSTEIRPRRLDLLNETAFDRLDNEEALYWLGFAYADSNVTYNIFRWGLGLKDAEHLAKLIKFLNSDAVIKISDTCCSVDFCHPYLANRLTELGLIPRRGQFHKLAKEIPTGLEHHFIRGYLDGDGCISNREKVIILGQQDILLWIKSCFVKYAQASEVVMPYQRKGIMEITFGGYNQFRRIVDYIYKDATIFLERKKEIADKTKRG